MKRCMVGVFRGMAGMRTRRWVAAVRLGGVVAGGRCWRRFGWVRRWWCLTTVAGVRPRRALAELLADRWKPRWLPPLPPVSTFTHRTHRISLSPYLFKSGGNGGKHTQNARSSAIFHRHRWWQLTAILPPVTAFRPHISHPTGPFRPSRQQIPAEQWQVVANCSPSPAHYRP